MINVPFVVACVAIIRIAIPDAPRREAGARSVDVPGALLCAAGLGGHGVRADRAAAPRLVERGRARAADRRRCAAGRVRRAYEARTRDPMLPLRLFRRRNFSAGNIETFSMYAGLAILFFFLILFLQQIGGYSPLKSGLTTLPVTVVMFVLSRRFGALADRFGPRLFMGAGPLVCAARAACCSSAMGVHVDYVRDVLPPLLLFSLGLSMTVAPLTAAVLADATSTDAGIASGVNNAIARVAGLMGTAAVGAAVAGSFVANLDRRLAGVQLERAGARGGGGGQAAAAGPPGRARRCRRRRRTR